MLLRRRSGKENRTDIPHLLKTNRMKLTTKSLSLTAAMDMVKTKERLRQTGTILANKHSMNKLLWWPLLLLQAILARKRMRANQIRQADVRNDWRRSLPNYTLLFLARPMAERTANPVFEVVPEEILQVKIADLGNACWTVRKTSAANDWVDWLFPCSLSINISRKTFKHGNIDLWKWFLVLVTISPRISGVLLVWHLN